jgi:hypothetical protein
MSQLENPPKVKNSHSKPESNSQKFIEQEKARDKAKKLRKPKEAAPILLARATSEPGPQEDMSSQGKSISKYTQLLHELSIEKNTEGDISYKSDSDNGSDEGRDRDSASYQQMGPQGNYNKDYVASHCSYKQDYHYYEYEYQVRETTYQNYDDRKSTEYENKKPGPANGGHSQPDQSHKKSASAYGHDARHSEKPYQEQGNSNFNNLSSQYENRRKSVTQNDVSSQYEDRRRFDNQNQNNASSQHEDQRKPDSDNSNVGAPRPSPKNSKVFKKTWEDDGYIMKNSPPPESFTKKPKSYTTQGFDKHRADSGYKGSKNTGRDEAGGMGKPGHSRYYQLKK